MTDSASARMLMNKIKSLKTLLICGAFLIFLLSVMAISKQNQKRHEPLPLSYHLRQDSLQVEPNGNFQTPQREQQGQKPITVATAPCSQAERLHALSQYCKANPMLQDYLQDSRSELDIYRKFLVDKKHKILFCQVPKAAGSYWRTMFTRGTGADEDSVNIHRGRTLKEIGLEFLHTFPPEEQRVIIQTYFKVMTVRHPMERALSAYVDKFTASKLTDALVACVKHTNKHYRSSNNKIHLKNGPLTIPSGLTWDDFTSLVIDSTSPYNPHWDSAFRLCHPCVIQYDYIIRTETMATDSGHILKLLSRDLDEELKLEIVHSQRNNTVEEASIETFAKVLTEYGKIPKEKLAKVIDIYRHDMSLFGYNFNETSKEATCGYDLGHGGICC